MPFASAVVTGAGSGIGRALAIHLGDTETRLTLADINEAALTDIAHQTAATAVPTDIADPHAMQALAAIAGTVDLVCLNAGIVGSLGAPWEIEAGDWDRVFGVNVGGVVNGLRAFVPRLLAAGRPAAVLITGSLAGLASFPGNGAYGPSKRAVIAVAEQAALALAGTAVSVTLVCPALVRTGMSEIGEDPTVVAAAAIAAAERKQFGVIPLEWHGAVTSVNQRLLSGEAPLPPTIPTDAP
jgi:NADP-dependent 3-hydroxy acid dehydrogenase YdfG